LKREYVKQKEGSHGSLKKKYYFFYYFLLIFLIFGRIYRSVTLNFVNERECEKSGLMMFLSITKALKVYKEEYKNDSIIYLPRQQKSLTFCKAKDVS